MEIHDKLTHSMQRVMRAVAKDGYHYWTSGSVGSDRAHAFAEKCAERYGTRLTADQRHYRRKHGQAMSRLIAFNGGGEMPTLKWILLATDGKGAVRSQEQLLDARDAAGRIVFLDYILQQTRRPKELGGGLHWSWWLTPQCVERIRSEATRLARNEPELVGTYLHFQCRRPMFSGVRSQVRRTILSAHKLYAACWPGRPWPGPEHELPYLGRYLSVPANSQTLRVAVGCGNDPTDEKNVHQKSKYAGLGGNFASDADQVSATVVARQTPAEKE